MSEPVVNIFVTYSHQDPEYLRDDSLLGYLKGLEKQGNVKFWTDRNLIGSDEWDKVIKENLQESLIALVLVSQPFLDSDYCRIEIEHLLRQNSHLFPIMLSPCTWQEHEWLASRQCLPGGRETIETHYTAPGPRKGLFLEIRMELQSLIDEARTELRRQLSEPTAVVQTESKPLWQGSPFRGLETFTQNHAAIFFGRSVEISELLQKLVDNRFLAVVGASGSGKSSLVAAGLLPHLADLPGGADWLTVRFTPGGVSDDPFLALAGRLEPHMEAFGWNTRKIAEKLRGGGDLAALAELILESQPEGELLLFVDQFEELFTLSHTDHHEPFMAMLAKAAQTEQVRIVLTLRADFYHRCIDHADLAGLLRTGSFPLATPGAEALLEMMTRPAALAGLAFEAGLPGRVLEDTGREPGALALMAFALEKLYEHRDQQKGTLTHAAYDELGGVQGVINKHADETYAQLNDVGQSALGRVFKELVEVDPARGVPTRKRGVMTLFNDEPAALALIERFTEARLLVRNRTDQQEDVVEVAHEAVLTHWEVLKNWIETCFDDFRLLRQVRLAAAEWVEKECAEPYLWPHERLAPVAKMLERLHPVELSPEEREFVRPEGERLLDKIKDRYISHQERVKIGDRLAEIGDPRPGVGLNDHQLPDFVWCEVPGGKVTLEGDAGTFDVAPGDISKYLVTWAQYRCFLEAEDGYANAAWWEGLAQRQEEGEEGQHWRLDNYPAETVSWYDAMAYCRWLSAKLGYDIRLPTEWEWQQAATGGNPANEYPWGSDWDHERANTGDSRLARTTAVGMYPHGASPVGALDMSGNVYEWCLNLRENPGNMDLSSSSGRVVRGGSWAALPLNARASSRVDSIPSSRGGLVGFRVWCSSPIRF
jgi:formylglycine-generating enzyme required for sulfatase activity